MASVASVNPGVGTLLQTFSRAGSSALSSALSSSTVQSALNNAAPVDIVQLSDEAVQLQQTSSLFGDGGTSSSATDPGTQLLQSVGQQDAANQVIDSGSGSAAAATTSSAASPSTYTAANQTPSEAVASYLFGSGYTDASGNTTLSYLG